MFNYNIYIVQLRQIVFQPSLYVMWIMPTGRTQLWTVDLAELHKKKKINSLESNWIGNLQKQNFFFSVCVILDDAFTKQRFVSYFASFLTVLLLNIVKGCGRR